MRVNAGECDSLGRVGLQKILNEILEIAAQVLVFVYELLCFLMVQVRLVIVCGVLFGIRF